MKLVKKLWSYVWWNGSKQFKKTVNITHDPTTRQWTGNKQTLKRWSLYSLLERQLVKARATKQRFLWVAKPMEKDRARSTRLHKLVLLTIQETWLPCRNREWMQSTLLKANSSYFNKAKTAISPSLTLSFCFSSRVYLPELQIFQFLGMW